MKEKEEDTKHTCANRCNWPNCTFSDCMEKFPDEWAKSGTHKFIEEALNNTPNEK